MNIPVMKLLLVASCCLVIFANGNPTSAAKASPQTGTATKTNAVQPTVTKVQASQPIAKQVKNSQPISNKKSKALSVVAVKKPVRRPLTTIRKFKSGIRIIQRCFYFKKRLICRRYLVAVRRLGCATVFRNGKAFKFCKTYKK